MTLKESLNRTNIIVLYVRWHYKGWKLIRQVVVIGSDATAKSLQSCLILCSLIDGSPPRWASPWDSPGKNTGVGCHFLLQHMKVKSESEVAQSCPNLSDPMDYSLPGSFVHGIFQARVLEWGAIAFSHHKIYSFLYSKIRRLFKRGRYQGKVFIARSLHMAYTPH